MHSWVTEHYLQSLLHLRSQFCEVLLQVAHTWLSHTGHSLFYKNFPSSQEIHFPFVSQVSHSPKQGVTQLVAVLLQVPQTVLSQAKQVPDVK